MHERFEARNDLEHKLLEAQEGSLPEDEFMQYLMEAQVFMPVRDAIGIAGFTGSSKAIPLTLNTEDALEVLVLFSSPDRAKEFVREFPGYEGGLLANGCWNAPAAASAFPSIRTGQWAWTWNRRWSSS